PDELEPGGAVLDRASLEHGTLPDASGHFHGSRPASRYSSPLQQPAPDSYGDRILAGARAVLRAQPAKLVALLLLAPRSSSAVLGRARAPHSRAIVRAAGARWRRAHTAPDPDASGLVR